MFGYLRRRVAVGFLSLGLMGSFLFGASDLCENAEVLGPVWPAEAVDTTAGATVDAVPWCFTGASGPGVWYQVVGMGYTMVASTCSEFTGYDTRLTVFKGNCGKLICVADNDDSGDGSYPTCSRVSWCGELVETYYILVHGKGSASGVFDLTVWETDEACCQLGEVLVPPASGLAMTQYMPTGSLPSCYEPLGAAGRWYRFFGTGNIMAAHTCSEFTTYDTRISVYKGYCGDLECVVANDDSGEGGCGSGNSYVEFCTDSGQMYYLLFHGHGTEAGEFEYSVFDTGVSCHAVDGSVVCGDLVSGSTVGGADLIDAYSCSLWNESGPERVYLFEPEYDGEVTVSLSGLSADLDVFVLEGASMAENCIGYGNSSKTFTAEATRTYYISVDGYGGASGPFTLSVSCEEAAVCSVCGAGDHWVDGCVSKQDTMLTTLLALSIDTDLDGIPDANMVLDPCPLPEGLWVLERVGALDDSAVYPGTRTVDGHLDVMDTEIVSMCLANEIATFVAGRQLGVGSVLSPSLGVMAESESSAEIAESVFNVFFELDIEGDKMYYNQTPLILSHDATCVPLQLTYVFFGNLELYSSHDPSLGTHIGNLISARFTVNPGDEPFCPILLAGDVNEDCYVDLFDFAMMAGDWLTCNDEMDPGRCFDY